MRFMQVICAVLLVISIGCGKDSEKTTIKTPDGTATVEKNGDKMVVNGADGTKTTVEKNGQKMKVVTKDGQFTVGDSKLPEGFPLSLSPGSNIKQSNHMTPNDGDEVFQVNAEVAGEPKDVAAFYEKALAGKGLKVERMESSSDKGSHVMLAGRGDKTEASIMVMKEAGAANCNVVVTWSKKGEK